nr:MAG TPA: hypothetical protein [Caudoviricetes sp.]
MERNSALHHGIQKCRSKPYQLTPTLRFGSAVPSFQLHPVFGTATERVPPNDATSRFDGTGTNGTAPIFIISGQIIRQGFAVVVN